MQIAAACVMLDNTNMTQVLPNATFRTLAQVKPADLSWNAWAMKAGVGRSIFTEIRRHGNPTSETIDKLLAAIDLPRSGFEARRAGTVGNVADTGMTDAQAQAAMGDPLARLASLPLVGSAIGGAFETEEHVELTELDMSEVLEHLPRPDRLAGDRRAYALTIVGDSMAPRFEPGEIALVSPRQPVGIGDDVILQLRSEATGSHPDPDHANRVTMVLIKRLVRRSAREVTLRQFNPETEFTVPLERVAAIHKVVGRV